MRFPLILVLPLFLLLAAALILAGAAVVGGGDGVGAFDLVLEAVVFGGDVLFQNLLAADLALFFHAELALSGDALEDGPRKWVELGHTAADLGAASPLVSIGHIVRDLNEKKIVEIKMAWGALCAQGPAHLTPHGHYVPQPKSYSLTQCSPFTCR